MKKYLLSIFLILLLPVIAYSWMGPIIVGCGNSTVSAGGGGCDLGATTVNANNFEVSSGNLMGSKFTASCSGGISEIKFYFVGTNNSSTAIAIYADAAGSVSGTPLGYSGQQAVGSGGTWITHTGGTLGSISIINGTTYWLILWADDDGSGTKMKEDGTDSGAHAWYNYGTTYSTDWPSGGNFTTGTNEFSIYALVS